MNIVLVYIDEDGEIHVEASMPGSTKVIIVKEEPGVMTEEEAGSFCIHFPDWERWGIPRLETSHHIAREDYQAMWDGGLSPMEKTKLLKPDELFKRVVTRSEDKRRIFPK